MKSGFQITTGNIPCQSSDPRTESYCRGRRCLPRIGAPNFHSDGPCPKSNLDCRTDRRATPPCDQYASQPRLALQRNPSKSKQIARPVIQNPASGMPSNTLFGTNEPIFTLETPKNRQKRTHFLSQKANPDEFKRSGNLSNLVPWCLGGEPQPGQAQSRQPERDHQSNPRKSNQIQGKYFLK